MKDADVVVIGGGAAGMMAALAARASGAQVTLLEPNEKLGRKLYITGKGRCNLTNDTSPEDVLQHVVRNGRFLNSAVRHFPPASVKSYFQVLGVPLKTERGGRVFPQSDKAADVIDALFFTLKRHRVQLVKDRAEKLLWENGRIVGVQTAEGSIPCRAVVLATGGMSYPLTGSTGDGYRLAKEVGHSIVTPQASLIPLVEQGTLCVRMQGLSLRNVGFYVKNKKGKTVFSEQGELLFTHFGLSGPLVLSASAHVRDFDKEQYTAVIDLKPALDEEKLEERLLRDFAEQQNRSIQNVLEGLLPRLMIPVMLEVCDILPETRIHTVTKQQRRRLLEHLKRFRIPIAGVRPLEEAIVTAGGVKTTEVDPGSMMSKKMPGLFLAGELLDVDAYTGGFNLQIAWCTGHLAGESAAAYCHREETTCAL